MQHSRWRLGFRDCRQAFSVGSVAAAIAHQPNPVTQIVAAFSVKRDQANNALKTRAASRAEYDRVHDAAGNEREQAGDDERADENEDHRHPMLRHPVAVGVEHRDRQHDQRENRQQVDRAPRTPEPELMNPRTR
jgi:hypothetical protein